jgi:hypothetical protein
MEGGEPRPWWWVSTDSQLVVRALWSGGILPDDLSSSAGYFFYICLPPALLEVPFLCLGQNAQCSLGTQGGHG